MPILDFIAQTIVSELIIVITGVLFAYLIKNQYDNWRYGRWRVRVRQNSQEKVNRPVSPRKTKEILDEPTDLAVFLKGVVSPYDWINCDLISEGQTIGLLTIDPEEREFIINLDKNPKKEAAAPSAIVNREPNTAYKMPDTPATGTTTLSLINFTHPLTEPQRVQIEQLTGQIITAVHPAPTQLDNNQSFAPQVAALLNTIPLTPTDWQTRPILINPPAYAPAVATLLAELHGRMGYFPTIIRLRPVVGTTPPQFEVAEMINLQAVRDGARESR